MKNSNDVIYEATEPILMKFHYKHKTFRSDHKPTLSGWDEFGKNDVKISETWTL